MNQLQKNSPVPVQNFTIIPQSPFHVKIIYQSLFCIEIISGSNNLTIRDGSYTRNGVDIFAPIPGFQVDLNSKLNKQINEWMKILVISFQTFLESFMNEMQSVKVHIKEEDAQSSPMGVEQMDFMSTGMNFLSHNSPLTHKVNIYNTPMLVCLFCYYFG